MENSATLLQLKAICISKNCAQVGIDMGDEKIYRKGERCLDGWMEVEPCCSLHILVGTS